MKSFGEYLGQAGAGSIKINESLTIVDQRKFGNQLPFPRVHEVARDAHERVDVLDLNIREVTATAATHVLDLIVDFEGPIDVPAVVRLMKENQYDNLPSPFGPKEALDVPMPYTLQVSIYKLHFRKKTVH